MEWKCQYTVTNNTIAKAELGDKCDPDKGPYCKTNLCVKSGLGDGSRYCAAPCHSDAYCPQQMPCSDHVLIDRKGTANDLKITLCKKP